MIAEKIESALSAIKQAMPALSIDDYLSVKLAVRELMDAAGLARSMEEALIVPGAHAKDNVSQISH